MVYRTLSLKFVATLKEIDSLELLAASLFFSIGHVLEWCAVGTEVEADKLHDALTAHDVAAVVADDIDDILCKVLQLTCLLEVTGIPCVDDAHEVATIVVGSSTDATLCTTHGE